MLTPDAASKHFSRITSTDPIDATISTSSRPPSFPTFPIAPQDPAKKRHKSFQNPHRISTLFLSFHALVRPHQSHPRYPCQAATQSLRGRSARRKDFPTTETFVRITTGKRKSGSVERGEEGRFIQLLVFHWGRYTQAVGCGKKRSPCFLYLHPNATP